MCFAYNAYIISKRTIDTSTGTQPTATSFTGTQPHRRELKEKQIGKKGEKKEMTSRFVVPSKKI
jgi:hypothetical protein